MKIGMKRKEEWEEEGKRGTNFDGSDTQATGLEDDAYAAGGDAFAEAADDAAGDQHVLHYYQMNSVTELRPKCVCVCVCFYK